MSKLNAITVPKWGLSMEEGTLVSWLVNEGDTVNPGDAIAEIESSKIVNTLESHIAGVILRKVANEDDTLQVGGLLAVIGDESAPMDEIDAYVDNFKSESLQTISGGPEPSSQSGSTEPPPPQAGRESVDAEEIPETLKQGPDDSGVAASPHARRLARKLGINLNNVTGSGRNGRVSIEDIELAVQNAESQQADVEESTMSSTRQTIAERLQQSKSSIPHYRLIADARVDALKAIQSELNRAHNVKISINDILIKACSIALINVPECNVQMENNVIKKFRDTDISVAVALDSGLITPIIRAVNRKNTAQVAVEANELIEKARNGKLQQEEIVGGTFTISNLGMFGVKQFDAIINPPQCAILAVGKAEQRVIVENEQPAVATVMTLSLSLDHRVIDGAVGAGFLRELVKAIEQPELDNYN